MVRGYHLILTAYGFWLPNDPRGSWSTFVRSWELARFGDATKVTTRRSLAKGSHNHQLRMQAKTALAHTPVHFTGLQAVRIAEGFAACIAKSGAKMFACSILPDHVHMVVGRHRFKIEQMANLLKGEATKALRACGLHPFQSCPRSNGTLDSPWTRKYWKVYLNTDADVRRAIAYVEQNPVKEGKRQQNWAFVTPYVSN